MKQSEQYPVPILIFSKLILKAFPSSSLEKQQVSLLLACCTPYDFTIDGTSKRWYSKAIESYKRVIEVNNDGPLGLEASAELKACVNQLFLNR